MLLEAGAGTGRLNRCCIQLLSRVAKLLPPGRMEHPESYSTSDQFSRQELSLG